MRTRKNYRIHLDEAEIQKAIDDLKKVELDIRQKSVELCRQLAYIAMETAQQCYGDSIYMSIEETEDGCTVVAEGEAVCFFEFGAGDETDVSNPLANNVSFGVYPGSWSINHSQEYVKTGQWEFGGIIYKYIEPRRGMANASVAIRSNVSKEAERIFGIR